MTDRFGGDFDSVFLMCLITFEHTQISVDQSYADLETLDIQNATNKAIQRYVKTLLIPINTKWQECSFYQ